jgi:nucleoside phosphorylase
MRKIPIVWIVVVVLAACVPVQQSPVQRTVILSAFTWQTDDGMWHGESGPFLNRLDDGQDMSAYFAYCDQVWQGDIYDQAVAVVTMGVGKVRAASCMTEVLNFFNVRDVVWSGIAGVTPMVGGLVDEAGNFRDDEATVIGDVCISYISVDWDLQHSSYNHYTGDMQWWQMAERDSRVAVGSERLATELWNAAQAVEWPDVPEAPADNITKYHGADAVRKARAWDWSKCSEATGDNFWHSIAEDEQARVLIADAISDNSAYDVSPDDIFAVTAMEQTGWGYVIEAWNAHMGVNIPYAYSRSSSNFDHPWLDNNGRYVVDGPTSISAGMNEGGGAPYGSITAALPVLKMLELR